MEESWSASTKWMFSSPGMPKTYSTPSASSAWTMSRAASACVDMGHAFFPERLLPCKRRKATVHSGVPASPAGI